MKSPSRKENDQNFRNTSLRQSAINRNQNSSEHIHFLNDYELRIVLNISF